MTAPDSVGGGATSADDTDIGWGEAPGGRGVEDDERYLRDRPPHW